MFFVCQAHAVGFGWLEKVGDSVLTRFALATVHAPSAASAELIHDVHLLPHHMERC